MEIDVLRVDATNEVRKALLIVFLLFIVLMAYSPSSRAAECVERNAVGVVHVVEGEVTLGRNQLAHGSQHQIFICPGEVIRTSATGRAVVELFHEGDQPQTKNVAVAARSNFLSEAFFRIGPNSTIRWLSRLKTGGQSIEEKTNPILSIDKNTRGVFHFRSTGRISPFNTSTKEDNKDTPVFFRTPHVNGGIDGTEFVVNVTDTGTVVTVFEGGVVLWAVSGIGSRVVLRRNEASTTPAGGSPQAPIRIKSRDAVNWAVYFPWILARSVVDAEPMSQAYEAYNAGDFTTAFAIVGKVDPQNATTNERAAAAGLMLSLGLVEKANALLIEQSSESTEYCSTSQDLPAYVYALRTLLEIMRVEVLDPDLSGIERKQKVQSKNNKILNCAALAISTSKSAYETMAGYLVESYAHQWSGDLEAALRSVEQASQLQESEDVVAVQARFAEMLLRNGQTSRARDVARTTLDEHGHAAHAAEKSHVATVLGFTLLASGETQSAKQNFVLAIDFDAANPLAHLGLGLALVKQGQLEQAISTIATAASLDPLDAEIRSQLGRVHLRKGKYEIASKELDEAQAKDPNDPVPNLYRSILYALENKPVSAYLQVGQAINKNESRRVHRSRLQLNEDLATRFASIGHIYLTLGLTSPAIAQASKAMHYKAGQYAAHQLMADGYSSRPRHELARASEVLQTQMRQPLLSGSTQPLLGEGRLKTLKEISPYDSSLNEYGRNYSSQGGSLRLTATRGSEGTFGDNLVLSHLGEATNISFSQYHYETRGVRDNNDEDTDSLNLFAKYRVGPKLTLNGEVRSYDSKHGEQFLGFDQNDFFNDRYLQDTTTERIGVHYRIDDGSDWTALIRHEAATESINNDDDGFFRDVEENGYQLEIQHERLHQFGQLVLGGTMLDQRRVEESFNFDIQKGIPSLSPTRHDQVYIYNQFPFRRRSGFLTLGLSYDDIDTRIIEPSDPHEPLGPLNQTESPFLDESRLSGKFGFVYSTNRGIGNASSTSTTRFAAFRKRNRTLLGSQTMEPTNIAGFNQLYDDSEGTVSDNIGFAHDYVGSGGWHVGYEGFYRKLDSPSIGSISERRKFDIGSELRHKIHLSGLSAERQGVEYSWVLEAEEINQHGNYYLTESRLQSVDTSRISLKFSAFFNQGTTVSIAPTCFYQRGTFMDKELHAFDGADKFCVVDFGLKHQISRNIGTIGIKVDNVLNRNFNFQDEDPYDSRHFAGFPDKDIDDGQSNYRSGRRFLLFATLNWP